MRYFLTYFFFFTVLALFAQDPQLFDYQWRLEKIVTAEETFIPSPEPDPNTGTFDYIYFYDNNPGYDLRFGVYGSVLGHDIVYDDSNNSFEVSFFTFTLGEASPAALFITDNYLYLDGTDDIINNPFNYEFRFENDLIYLDIVNNEGSVATFYDNFLTQDEFLKQNLKFYPNPVRDKLFVESSNIQIQQIVVYDLRGRVVLKKKTFDGYGIKLESLNQGVYILRIETSKGQLNKKIIKK